VNTLSRNLHGARYNVFEALCSDGIAACQVYRNTGNLETLLDFVLYHLLPVMNPYPLPNSVLLLDNAKIHLACNDLLTKLCKTRGVLVRFLPTYSPDMNPIELMFNVAKSSIRRDYIQLRDHDEPGEEIKNFFAKIGTRQNAAEWFRHAGYK